MARVPSTYVPLGEAVIKAACVWFSKEIREDGLTSEEVATLFRWKFARAKVAANPPIGLRRGDRPKGIPVSITPQDREAAAETLEIKALRDKVNRIKDTPREAYERLRDMLSVGHLTGFIFGEDGRPHELEPHLWNAEDADTAHERGLMRFGSGYGEWIIGPAAVLKADLENILAGEAVQLNGASAPSEPPITEQDAGAEPRSSRGAPKRYDEIELLIQVARLIYEGTVPTNQSELRSIALDEYQKATGQTPSEEWAKPIIRRFWKGLELERRDKKGI